MTINGGILAAMLTPFEQNGEICTAAVPALVDYILSTGVDGLYAGGSSGECILQSTEERATLLESLAGCAKGRCTLIAHVGSASTDTATTLGRLAGELGYDGVSAIPPFYYPHDSQSIVNYYKSIASASGLPLIIYNIPALTGVDLGTSGLMQLLKDDRIIGIKFTATDLFQYWQLRSAAPDKQFFFGTDEMFLSAAATGTDGGIGSTYNLIGDVYVGIMSAIKNGDLATARELQYKSNELVDVLKQTGVLPGLKYALTKLGVPVGQCREPFQPPTPESLVLLDNWMERHMQVRLARASG